MQYCFFNHGLSSFFLARPRQFYDQSAQNIPIQPACLPIIAWSSVGILPGQGYRSRQSNAPLALHPPFASLAVPVEDADCEHFQDLALKSADEDARSLPLPF